MTTTYLEWFPALQNRHYLKIGANLFYVNWVFLPQTCFIQKHVSFGACAKTCHKITAIVDTFFILSPPQFNFSLPLPTLHKHNFGQKRESGQTSVYQIQVNSLHKQANLTANLCRKSISFTATYPQSCNLNQTESLCLNKIKWAEEISDVWKSLFRSSTKSKEPEVFEHVHTCTEKMLLA